MAKVIRPQWVYKKHNHWYRYLPRRHDGHKEFEYGPNNATPDLFPDPMDEKPPKLFVAWVYRELTHEPHWIKKRVWKLFGKEFIPGDMQVFKVR